jgi:eukaryotic-like serine/threonine-protein kinase
MDHFLSEEPLTPDLMGQISARRDEFQRAWIAGKSPRIEDGLENSPSAARQHLLRALLDVEVEYRVDGKGAPLTEQQLVDLHPALASDLRRAFQELRQLATRREGGELITAALPQAASVDEFATNDRRYQTRDQGFHIRCPHCCNPVEMLDDTAYDDINCGSCGSVFSLVNRSEPANTASTMKSIGRFDLVDCLGTGAFGTVWKARDPELDRIVALKVPRGGRLSKSEGEFFFREARAAAQLRHPNIVPVHEVGRDGDTLFIVSDFVKGITLLDWLKGRRPTPLAIADLCSVIAEGLHHAHEKGVVHRDLKPANILIDDSDQPHIMDFGLAKREIGEVTMTIDGQILGTPAYMSPEQAGGEGHWTDRRSDIYSLGVIAFEMLTGELPFRGNYQMQIRQRLTEDPPDPRKLNRHVSSDLATICVKCMDRIPGRRYATSAEVAAEFRRFTNGEPILARPISGPVRLARWAKRKPLVATIAGLIIFLAIAGPASALFVEHQKSRLAALVAEKNNLIDQNGIEKHNDVAKIKELSAQLDLWEGRANPWEYWPPKREGSARQKLVDKFFNYATTALGTQSQSGTESGDDEALGELGLAILADDLGQTSDAIEHYEKGRDRLKAMSEDAPQRSELARALAGCETALARLIGDKDRAAAAKHLESAREIHRRLAIDHAKTASFQIEWLESELDGAALVGFEGGSDRLTQAARIDQSLPARWPSKPAGIYRLACFLTEKEPILASAGVDAAP